MIMAKIKNIVKSISKMIPKMPKKANEIRPKVTKSTKNKMGFK